MSEVLMTVELNGLFKLAPTAAIKYFQKKGNSYSWDWYDLWEDAHKKLLQLQKLCEKIY